MAKNSTTSPIGAIHGGNSGGFPMPTMGKNGEETTKGPKETWWVWLLWLGNEAWILFSLFSVEYL